MYKCRLRKCDLIGSIIAIVLVLSPLSSPFFSLNPFYEEAVASSSAFELQEITDENRQWVQTYGNNDENLKCNYTDILAVNYISDGKYLNVTMWLASGFANNSTSPPEYNQPFRKISYGMLIDADSNTNTGYNGADYDLCGSSRGETKRISLSAILNRWLQTSGVKSKSPVFISP